MMVLYTVNAVPMTFLSAGKYTILPINSPMRLGVTKEKERPAKTIFRELNHGM